MNHSSVVVEIARKTGYTHAEVEMLLRAFSEVIIEAVGAGNSVRVQRVGIFEMFLRGPRRKRNMFTGEVGISPSRWKLRFVGGTKLKLAVERGNRALKKDSYEDRFLKGVTDGQIRSSDRPEESNKGKDGRRQPRKRASRQP